jgi:hypothetical protein
MEFLSEIRAPDLLSKKRSTNLRSEFGRPQAAPNG